MTEAQPSLLARVAVDVTPLRTSQDFRRLWAGRAVSGFAWRMLSVLVAVQVYRLTGSTLAVGLVALTQFVPLVVVTVVGGGLADARDRRAIVLVSNGGVALAVAGLVAASTPHGVSVAVVFVLSLLAWSSFSLGTGAVRSLTPRLVPLEQLPAAAALEGIHTSLSMVVGPALAGVLIGQIGLPATYGVSLGALVAGTAMIATIGRVPPLEGAPRLSFAAIADGFRYVATQRLVLSFFLIDTLAMIFGMPMSLFPALAQHVFRNPSSVGYLFAAPAVGSLLVSLSSGWAMRVRAQGVAIVVAVTGWGASIVAFGFVRTLWPALVLLAVAGAADMVSAIFRGTIVQTVTPDHMRGRVGGIEFAQVASTPALGNLEAGLVASLTSLRFSIVSGGVACLASTFAIAVLFPGLLRYRAPARA